MFINTENKNKRLWLVKMPSYIGDELQKIRRAGSIGAIGIEADEDGKGPKMTIEFSGLLSDSGIPTQHNVVVKEKEDGIYILSRAKEWISVDGCITKQCFVKPVVNKEYLEFKSQIKSTKGEESQAGKTQFINHFKELGNRERYIPLKEVEMLSRKRRKLLQTKKRERLESQDVMDMIFRAFEEQDVWTPKDLSDLTGQPMAYIMELISEICVLNKKDHRNAYELKPEYKNTSYYE